MNPNTKYDQIGNVFLTACEALDIMEEADTGDNPIINEAWRIFVRQWREERIEELNYTWRSNKKLYYMGVLHFAEQVNDFIIFWNERELEL
jgi:hypothetical protein